MVATIMEVYRHIRIWCHNAKGLLQGDVNYSAIKNISVAITSCNFCFLCSGLWHAKRRRRRRRRERLVTHWWSSVQTCATTSNIMMKLTCGTGKCFNNSPRHTHQWEHVHVCTVRTAGYKAAIVSLKSLLLFFARLTHVLNPILSLSLWLWFVNALLLIERSFYW